jgi:hypothetical protein
MNRTVSASPKQGAQYAQRPLHGAPDGWQEARLPNFPKTQEPERMRSESFEFTLWPALPQNALAGLAKFCVYVLFDSIAYA